MFLAYQKIIKSGILFCIITYITIRPIQFHRPIPPQAPQSIFACKFVVYITRRWNNITFARLACFRYIQKTDSVVRGGEESTSTFTRLARFMHIRKTDSPSNHDNHDDIGPIFSGKIKTVGLKELAKIASKTGKPLILETPVETHTLPSQFKLVKSWMK